MERRLARSLIFQSRSASSPGPCFQSPRLCAYNVSMARITVAFVAWITLLCVSSMSSAEIAMTDGLGLIRAISLEGQIVHISTMCGFSRLAGKGSRSLDDKATSLKFDQPADMRRWHDRADAGS